MLPNVLLVEDNPADVELLHEAFRECAVHATLHVSPDGCDAVGFLHRQHRHLLAPRPDLIILDLNLPKLDGQTVLQIVKHDPELRAIPVVVLSTAATPAIIARCKALSIAAYVTKPSRWEDVCDSVRDIGRLLPDRA
ncbi:MAG: response regulator [Planctomycetes bacterium]|nr:response regulator [Planctomycetota bacterium]